VELENFAHLLHVLRRQRPGRPNLIALDRLLWVWLYRLWPRCLDTMMFVKPATVIKWPRRGFGSIGVGVQGPDAYQWIARFVI
jgi:hypothetical protein